MSTTDKQKQSLEKGKESEKRIYSTYLLLRPNAFLCAATRFACIPHPIWSGITEQRHTLILQ